MMDFHTRVNYYLGFGTAATWLLTLLGLLLAVTVAPGAINMAVGCGIWAVLFTVALVHWNATK